jgi:hypothetical protein
MPQLRPSPATVHTGSPRTWAAVPIRRVLLAYQVGVWVLAICISCLAA